MYDSTSSEKEALQRQLEHHLDDLCDDITKNIKIISEHTHVTEDNFECMTYVGESLESLQSAVFMVMEYIASVKTTEKLINKLLSPNIKIE